MTYILHVVEVRVWHNANMAILHVFWWVAGREAGWMTMRVAMGRDLQVPRVARMVARRR